MKIPFPFLAKLCTLSMGQKLLVGGVLVLVTLWGGSKENPKTQALPLEDHSLVTTANEALHNTAESAQNEKIDDLPTVTTNDIARGWRLASETVGNALVPMPAGAVTNDLLRRRGGYDWAFRVEPPDWRFPFVGGTLTGVTVLARGEVRPNVRTTFFPMPLTNEVSLLPMTQWHFVDDEPSVFTHAVTPSNSLLLAWWNALAGRNAHCPTNLQMELFANGAFTWRTMDRTTTYVPVFPFDWDGDGLANEVDPEPHVANACDAHGTNAEWYRLVCSNVFERVEVPGNATDDADSEASSESMVEIPGIRFRADVHAQAYYFVDVVASEGPAPITFTADRASRLGSPVVVAQGDVTNHVPLLVGVRYEVSSPSPIVFFVPKHVVVMQSDAWNATLQYPLTFPAVEGFAGSTRIYSMGVQPIDPGGTFSWNRSAVRSARLLSAASTSSCACWSGLGNTVSFVCGYNEGCHGGCKAMGTYAFESASFSVTGGVCRCEFDDPESGEEPPSETTSTPGVSVAFSRSAVIFEETYQEYQDVWEPRRSTRVRLDVSAYGGSNGGTVNFSCKNLSKLTPIACGPLTLPSTVTLEAGESYDASFLCEGVEASTEAEDVVVNGTFTENTASAEPMQSEARLSVVRVEVQETIDPPDPRSRMLNRHTFGVREKIELHQFPMQPKINWASLATDGTFVTNSTNVKTLYQCPLDAYENPLRGLCDGSSYIPLIKIIEPESVQARLLHGLSRKSVATFELQKGTAGGVGMYLKLTVLPLFVSFTGIKIEEVPQFTYQPSGYFTNPYYNGAFGHTTLAGAGNWLPVETDNVFAHDMAAYNDAIPWLTPQGHITTDPAYSWTSGSVYIDHPFGWNEVTVQDWESPHKMFATNEKVEIMLLENGTVGVRKLFNRITRTTNDVIHLNGVLIK